MPDHIDTLAALEAVIGKTPPAVNLKVIDHLDESALRWITASPLMFAGFGDGARIAVTLGGGAPGFAPADRAMLRLPLDTLDDPALAQVGQSFGALFLAPGIGETLRVNGRVTEIADGEARIAVDECYGHCAKALIRSTFWAAEPIAPTFDSPGTFDSPEAFVAQSRFMALATMNSDGAADLSPKGDPAGAMAALDGDDLWFADRPGNRRVDSFRNIIAQPGIGAALLIPGSHQVAIVEGAARLTTDAAQRARFAVQDKVPLLAIEVAGVTITLRTSGALERANLWPSLGKAEGIDPAKMFVAHVKLNKDKGLGARMAGAVMSIPGLMQKGLDSDYKSNLY